MTNTNGWGKARPAPKPMVKEFKVTINDGVDTAWDLVRIIAAELYGEDVTMHAHRQLPDGTAQHVRLGITVTPVK